MGWTTKQFRSAFKLMNTLEWLPRIWLVRCINLKPSLDQAFENKITRNQYTQGYGRVYKICIAVDPKSSELYSKISQFLEEKADFISKGLQNAEGPVLLEKYCSEWKSYKKAAEDINSICRYLNINHIDSKRHDSMEVQLSQGKVSPDRRTSQLMKS